MARAFAAAGVLHALEEAKIPIGGIAGTEMGALIGSVYALSGSINDFDWAMMRFKNSTFVDPGSLLTRWVKGPSEGKALNEALERALGARDLRQASHPLDVIADVGDTAEPRVFSEGNAAKLLRGALAVPGLLTPAEFSGIPVRSAASKRPFPVTEAKLLGSGPVIVVDVLGDADSPRPTGQLSYQEQQVEREMSQARAHAQSDLSAADLVLQPDLRGIGFLDFKRRTEIAFRGKSAVKKNLARIRHLVGLPEREQ
jgi:NTE family protein